ncbi:MAG TPA: Rrf2 family transcriptional regulator [Pseudolabrys sp.]|jgi:Rrf2 family protein|uniref:Rrf2 family transcriptional regulator n=1 Tax=Pseudolabrys sp. TaxID=1960880 RepID=UPI002DDDAF66|nr:Rrf2 family transcriptional regulator [Pseudolabrys sp.]HEV2628412.1 Rrf2 family transcriptional regulator [Pseudolabrys sp.]
MKLQQATRYALWAVVELASRANEQVRAQELAERYDLSQNHMVRVLHALTKAKIVKSARGPGGGFTFCANANRLTVYDIICLFETGWPNEESTEHQQHNPVVGELGRVLHEVDRITWATLRSVTIQTIIKNATRAAASRPKADPAGTP